MRILDSAELSGLTSGSDYPALVREWLDIELDEWKGLGAMESE